MHRNSSLPARHRRRVEGLLTGRYPCYRIYPCADGYLAVGALEPKFWREFVEVDRSFRSCCRAALPTARRGGERSAAVEAVLQTRTRAQWAETLAGHDVCVEPVLDVRETFEHPQVRSRGLRLEPGDGKPTAQTGFPIRLAGTARGIPASSSAVR